jgi:hypothetical protein
MKLTGVEHIERSQLIPGGVRRTGNLGGARGGMAMSGVVLLLLVGSAWSSEARVEGSCRDGQSAPIFSEVGTTAEDTRRFLAALQAAVATGDKRRVVSMIEYPIAAWVEDRDVRFRTPDRLLGSYDRVFTPQLKKTIAAARVECLFTNWQGIMVHDGEVWFRPFEGRGLKIVKINGSTGRD